MDQEEAFWRVEEVIMLGSNVVDTRLESFGWRTYVQDKRGTSKITINKNVAIGAGLSGGKHLYCYLAKDGDRPMVLVYLDGKPRVLC